MKLALHRSITFWSGLLVMAFIGWAWRDSMSFSSFLNFPKLFFASAQGGLAVTSRDDIVPSEKIGRMPPIGPAFEEEWRPAPYAMRGGGTSGVRVKAWKAQHPGVTGWHATQRMQMELATPSGWMIFIPHWLLLLAFALPWTALLLRRARRRKRAGTHPQTG